jgi:hypothetical protein
LLIMLAEQKTNRQPAERRRHQRVPVSVFGRYMLENRQEYPCQTINMSPGGVSFVAPVSGKVGERIVAYLDHLGRIEGKIIRSVDNGFVMSVQATIRKRDKLAAQLTWLTNRHKLALPEDRRHERIVPRISVAQITPENSTPFHGRLIDVSLSGAGLSSETRPALGTMITIGQTPARVVRHFPDSFNESIVF